MWNDAECGSLLWSARKLYNAIDADQKAAAKSDAGLPFGSLAGPLVDLISRERKAYDSHSSRLHKPGGSSELEAALASPSAATTLSFRIISEPISASPNRHVYYAAFSVKSGREMKDLWRERLINSSFPVLSSRRQSQLRRKALSNPTAK